MATSLSARPFAAGDDADRPCNDAPLLWMLQARGYDLSSLRKRETETERALRIANERISQLEQEREVERRLFRDLRVAA